MVAGTEFVEFAGAMRGRGTWLLRPLPHDFQCQPGKCAGIRELHFVGSNGRDDPALIRGSDEIWKRARLDADVDRFRVFVHHIRPSVGDRS